MFALIPTDLLVEPPADPAAGQACPPAVADEAPC